MSLPTDKVVVTCLEKQTQCRSQQYWTVSVKKTILIFILENVLIVKI
jgi:hypothetical protein